jgi:sortase A
VYVDALLAGKAQPVPPGVPATVSPASLPMHNDPSATVALIFWLEGLVLVTFAASWTWVRWGRFETWIVGAPVFLAVLWGTSDALMRFLPNLL